MSIRCTLHLIFAQQNLSMLLACQLLLLLLAGCCKALLSDGI